MSSYKPWRAEAEENVDIIKNEEIITNFVEEFIMCRSEDATRLNVSKPQQH